MINPFRCDCLSVNRHVADMVDDDTQRGQPLGQGDQTVKVFIA